MIIDSQVLVWSSATSPRDDGGLRHRATPLTTDVLVDEMDAAGVDRALVGSPPWDPTELEARRAVELRPDRFRRIARLPLDETMGRAVLADAAGSPGIAVVRASFWSEQGRRALEDGSSDWIWPLAERLGVRLACFAPDTAALVRAVASRHAALRLAIDHLGLTVEHRGRALTDAAEAVLDLARFPNVSVKASALLDRIGSGADRGAILAILRRAVDAFGPGRVFWGSDLSRLDRPYREAVELVRAAELSDAERGLVMGQALGAWLDWPQTDPPSSHRGRGRSASRSGLAVGT